jgi:hypothetical protein
VSYASAETASGAQRGVARDPELVGKGEDNRLGAVVVGSEQGQGGIGRVCHERGQADEQV